MFTLAQLEQAIRESWDLETSDDADWSPENPGWGQCDITSLVVHDLVGGELLAAGVYLGDERVESHMWNRLPSGVEIDLTRDQFRRGDVVGEPVVRPRPAELPTDHPRHHRHEQYLVLSERVRTRLGLR